ncbi:MAG: TonB family protein [Flavobacteriales bacterium]
MNNELMLYLFKSTYLFSVMYLIYKLAFSRTTFFQSNRWLLVLMIPFSTIMPLINLSSSGIINQFQIVLPEIVSSTSSTGTYENFVFNYGYILLFISGLLFMIFFIKLMGIAYKIHLIKSNRLDSAKPFSFFSFIHIPTNIPEENKPIIYAHEKIHAKQFHSADVMLYELFKIVFWFNPLVWLALKDVKTNHEYIADQLAGKKYLNSYTKVLVAQLLGVNCSDLANNFNYEPLIKKRIKMMKTKQSTKLIATCYSVIAPLAIVALLSAGSIRLQANTPPLLPTTEDQVYDTVDQMPEFKGGMPALMNYLGGKIKYPEEAKKNNAEGTVFVSFVVDKKGNIKNATIEKAVEKHLDQQALKVISSMPNWIPGKNRGEEVNVKIVLPIKYQLQ